MAYAVFVFCCIACTSAVGEHLEQFGVQGQENILCNIAATGDALFQTHENMEHLAMMEAVLGPIPKSMAQASKGLHNCFVGRDFRLNWPADASKRSIRCPSRAGRLFAMLLHNFESAGDSTFAAVLR